MNVLDEDMEVDAEWDFPFRPSQMNQWTQAFSVSGSLQIECKKYERLFGHIPPYYLIELEWTRQDKAFDLDRCNQILL
jgi:hypothetical protein